ncbi:MAG: zinc-ribbon domain-containing protein [Deltaproteobacteria bacterium]|nr:zinc-ribbon domain-containing protein [Deltaproteobacteria bacterium]
MATEGAGSVKVQCTSCGARYSLPGERVRGRLLRIRCKTCQNLFEVRVTEGSTAGAAVARGRKGWYVAVGGERKGPFTAQEVRDRFARGEVQLTTYAWHPSLTQWERLRRIEEFSDLAGGTIAEPPRASRPSGSLPRIDEPAPAPAPAPAEALPDTDAATAILQPDENRREEAVKLEGGWPAGIDTGWADPAEGVAQASADDDASEDEPARDEVRPAADAGGTGVPTAVSPNWYPGAAVFSEPGVRDEVVAQGRPGGLFGDALDVGMDKATIEESVPAALAAERAASEPQAARRRDPSRGGPRAAVAEERPPSSGATRGDPSRGDPSRGDPSRGDPSRGDPSRGDPSRDKLLKGERNESSVLFSLPHLANMYKKPAAAPKKEAEEIPSAIDAVAREGEVARASALAAAGEEAPASAKALAAPPPVLVGPAAGRGLGEGWGRLVGVAFGGAMLGAGGLVLAIYLMQPRALQVLLGRADGASGSVEVRSGGPTVPPRDPGTGAAGTAAPSRAADAGASASAPDAGRPASEAVRPAVVVVDAAPADLARGPDRALAAVPAKGGARPSGRSTIQKEDSQTRLQRLLKKASEAAEKGGGVADGESAETPPAAKPSLAAGEGDAAGTAEAKAPRPGELARTLSRAQIATGMAKAEKAVKRCHEKHKQPGQVILKVTISGSTGRIVQGEVLGDLAGTEAGGCVLEAAKEAARFPRFANPTVTLRYPYVLR